MFQLVVVSEVNNLNKNMAGGRTNGYAVIFNNLQRMSTFKS